MKNSLIALAILFSLPISAQNWAGIGNFNLPVRSFYNDTLTGELIITGNFSQINSDTIMGLARWDGSHISTYGCGLGWDCTTPFNTGGAYAHVAPSVRFNGTLFATGGFIKAGTETLNGLAFWNGTKWIGMGSGLKYEGGSAAGANGLKVIGNELYIYGGPFDSVAGVAANSLAKFNGVNWVSLNFPHISNGGTDQIFDIEQYKNELYVAGNFVSLAYPNDTIQNIIRFDGTNWKSVGGGIHGGYGISTLIVYNNELYVAGLFTKANGNAGDYIQKWDGTSWSDVGGGMGGSNGQIDNLTVHNGKLYAVGVFQSAGGVPAQYIAYWDGTDWCGLGSTFNNTIGAVCFYKDTLYIGGGFITIDGDTIHRVAKWIGGNYVDTCGNATGITEMMVKNNNVVIYPNPTNGNSINISFPFVKSGDYEVLDVIGAVVAKGKINNADKMEIDISTIANGCYIVKVQGKDKFYVGRFVKE